MVLGARTVSVSVQAVQVQVQQIVDAEAGGGTYQPLVDLAQQLPAPPTGLSRRSLATLGVLAPLAGQWVLAHGDLEVPPAPPIGIDTLRPGWHENLLENRLVLNIFSQYRSPCPTAHQC